MNRHVRYALDFYRAAAMGWVRMFQVTWPLWLIGAAAFIATAMVSKQ